MNQTNELQGCLFERDYLRRTLGTIANNPEVALTELVANAWDAGASKVEIVLPKKPGGTLTIKDDGTGMSEAEFRKKWMTLGYDRISNEGELAEFPPERKDSKRRAFGRNGVGRHGMLCFGSQYRVQTRKDGIESIFRVTTTSGKDPFKIEEHTTRKKQGHGTELMVIVERNLSSSDKVATVLSARFLHDPQFTVSVNGKSIPLANHEGLVNERLLTFADGCTAQAYFVDSTQAARNTQYQGVAFWIGGRLVGDPGWAAHGKVFMDGRTRIAKRYTVIVKSDDLFDDVTSDWGAFKKSERVEAFLDTVAEYVQEIFRKLSSERIQETTESVLREHAPGIKNLGYSARREVADFVNSVTKSQPSIQTESLSAAVKSLIEIEKTRTGASLIEKLSRLSDEDIAGLDRLLGDWTVRDALTVLDELDRRLRVVEAIEKLSADPKIDELHALHPLVTESRWLFGLEFDTPEYVSNVSLTRAMREIFKKRPTGREFDNPRKRTDILVLADATVSGVATEEFDESTLPKLSRVLLLELKRGGAEIVRDNLHQATDYIQDFLNSGLIDGTPYFRAYVIGHKVSDKVQKQFKIPDRADIEIATYSQLVRQANKRLFRLRDRLTSRYEEATGNDMLNRILSEPSQYSVLDLHQ